MRVTTINKGDKYRRFDGSEMVAERTAFAAVNSAGEVWAIRDSKPLADLVAREIARSIAHGLFDERGHV